MEENDFSTVAVATDKIIKYVIPYICNHSTTHLSYDWAIHSSHISWKRMIFQQLQLPQTKSKLTSEDKLRNISMRKCVKIKKLG
jgi:hypothetical protein